MKTRDLILDELLNSDRISLKELSERINKKLDATSHQVKNLVNEGVIRSERVRLGRSFITYVWLANKNGQLENNNIQVESLKSTAQDLDLEKQLAENNISDHNQKRFQVEGYKNRRIYENNTIQLEKDINPFDFASTNIKRQNTKGQLKLPLEKLRSFYYDLTLDKINMKGKTHRGKKDDLINEIQILLDKQRGV